MTELKEITAKMQELKKTIDYLIRATNYEEDEQLEIKYNIDSPDDLQMMDEYRNILYRLEDVTHTLEYLSKPIAYESTLQIRPDGRYGTDRNYYTSGSAIEFLYYDEVYDFETQTYKEVASWRSSRVEHDGNDYYIVGYRNVELSGLRVRVRK